MYVYTMYILLKLYKYIDAKFDNYLYLRVSTKYAYMAHLFCCPVKVVTISPVTLADDNSEFKLSAWC